MKLHFTSTYHPEGDGQTEQTNQTLEQYLRVYCNYQQDNWSELLPLAEFAYNNTPSATTGITPFFANKGYHLNLTVHPERDLASARARDFVTDLDELHQELWQHIAEAQHRYQTPADSRRLPAPEFKIGSHTYVKAQFFRTTRPPRSFPINSLDRTKSWHDPAPIPSLSDFRTVSALYTRFSTSQCWNQQPPIRSLIESSPHLCQLQSTMNPNSRFPKSSIPR